MFTCSRVLCKSFCCLKKKNAANYKLLSFFRGFQYSRAGLVVIFLPLLISILSKRSTLLSQVTHNTRHIPLALSMSLIALETRPTCLTFSDLQLTLLNLSLRWVFSYHTYFLHSVLSLLSLEPVEMRLTLCLTGVGGLKGFTIVLFPMESTLPLHYTQ